MKMIRWNKKINLTAVTDPKDISVKHFLDSVIPMFNFEIKDYPQDSAIWMFTEGNYACDCNRSLFIQQQFGEDAIPELPCGDTIELLEYHIEHEPYKC